MLIAPQRLKMATICTFLVSMALFATLTFSGTSATCAYQDYVPYVETTAYENSLDSLMESWQLGVTYTHWGKGSCGGNAEQLVYSGFMGGSHYTHSGGAAEYLCLPEEPEYGNFTKDYQGCATMHTAELQTAKRFAPFGEADQWTPKCSVCRIPWRSSQLMIPAKKTCPDTWTRRYHGYLMAGKHDQRRTEHICVDRNVELVPGTEDNKNGALLYMTEASASSEIPQPPYVREKEITCVVCIR